MTPIRALFFLAAITAACAGRIPGRVQESDSLETHIALLAHHQLTGNPITNGIEKLKELIEKIKVRVEAAEAALVKALESSSEEVVKKINEFILNRTGVDLNLDEKLKTFEAKSQACVSKFQIDLKDVIEEIETNTKACAAKQAADTKEIVKNVIALVEILKVVPVKTIANIKACGKPATPAPEPTAAPTTAAPTTAAPTTLAPEPDTEAPDTEAPITDAPTTEAPGTETPDELLLAHQSVHSWSDNWRKIKCVTKELTTAAKDLAEVPVLLEKVVSDVADLGSKASREAVQKCAAQSVAGKGVVVQEAAAQLAYCVIAPSRQ